MEVARPDQGPGATVAGPVAVPQRLVAGAFGALVAALLAGGVATVRNGHVGPLSLISLCVAAVVAVSATAVTILDSSAGRAGLRIVGIVAAGVAGAALGAAGHPEAAVVAVVPLAWLIGTETSLWLAVDAPFVAAAAGGVSGLVTGRTGFGGVLTAVAALTVGAGMAWCGRSFGDGLTAAAAERERFQRLRTEMVTTVSHELRTPLTVIQGATATLNRRWDVLSESERLDLIDVLSENVASLDASILHFVDAARLERGEVVVAPRWVDVAGAVDAAAARRMATLAGHDVRTELEVRTIWVDPTALERILEHLLMNAARFSSIGQPIIVRTQAGPGEVTVAVVDRGQGIPPHLLATVWEPLQRGDVGETGISRGAGLGLPIVRELARLHGGDATLRSWKGRGTSVTVSLPQPETAPGVAPAGQSAPGRVPPAPARVPPAPARVPPAVSLGLTAPLLTPEPRHEAPPADVPRRGALSRRVG